MRLLHRIHIGVPNRGEKSRQNRWGQIVKDFGWQIFEHSVVTCHLQLRKINAVVETAVYSLMLNHEKQTWLPMEIVPEFLLVFT